MRNRVYTTKPAVTAFGAFLQKSRKEKGLSQEALAQLAGLHASEISILENGARPLPGTNSLLQLARVFEWSEETILPFVKKKAELEPLYPIGKFIQTRRHALSLSQAELARLLGMDVGYFRNMELRRRHILPKEIEKLSGILACKAEELEKFVTIKQRTSNVLPTTEIGKRLRTARIAHGYTLESLGELMGLTREMIRNYEIIGNVPHGRLVSIAKILELDLAELSALTQRKDQVRQKRIEKKLKEVDSPLRKWLIEQRAKKGLTQKQLQGSDGSDGLVCHIEKGKRPLKRSVIEKIVKALGVEIPPEMENEIIEDKPAGIQFSRRVLSTEQKETYATRVRNYREMFGLTQKAFAERAQLSSLDISKIERGLEVTLRKLKKLDAVEHFLDFDKPTENPLTKEQIELFGQRIRAYRTQFNLTQTQVADLIGLQQKDISFIETGKKVPIRFIEAFRKLEHFTDFDGSTYQFPLPEKKLALVTPPSQIPNQTRVKRVSRADRLLARIEELRAEGYYIQIIATRGHEIKYIELL